MAEDDLDENDAADATTEEDLDEELEGKKLSGKKIVLFVVLPLLFILGGGIGLYLSGALDGMLGKNEETEHGDMDSHAEEDGYEFSDTPGFFYEVPDIIVNLNRTGSKQRFLKLNISLELDKEEDLPALEAVMPRVNDHFQTYLRELRIDDLEGSAGIYRLRQELLDRVRTAAYPVKIRDVLFGEILIQ